MLIVHTALLSSRLDAAEFTLEKLKTAPKQDITVVHEYHISKADEPIVATAAVPNEAVVDMELPDVSGEFKGYMDYRTITDKSSKQYLLRRVSYTDDQGFRMINGKYLVAVGKFYATEVGKELRVTLSSGTTIECIVGDIKAEAHTDENMQYVPGTTNIIEFIVDTRVMPEKHRLAGDVSAMGLAGAVIKIEEVIRDDA